MKTIGLVGGISWSSTVDYYRYLNEYSNEKMGGLHFSKCIVYSLDFDDFRRVNAAHDWKAATALLSDAALSLRRAGAEVIMLGANTAHIVADKVQSLTGLPLIDIRDVIGAAIRRKHLTRVGLLGTVYTMELEFYREHLQKQGIDVIIPSEKTDRDYIEDTLVHELGKGIIKNNTREKYITIANELINRGAQGIVLGCTEIPLLLQQNHFNVPVFNSTALHAEAAVNFALNPLLK